MAEICIVVGRFSYLRVGCIHVLELGRFRVIKIGQLWRCQILP